MQGEKEEEERQQQQQATDSAERTSTIYGRFRQLLKRLVRNEPWTSEEKEQQESESGVDDGLIDQDDKTSLQQILQTVKHKFRLLKAATDILVVTLERCSIKLAKLKKKKRNRRKNVKRDRNRLKKKRDEWKGKYDQEVLKHNLKRGKTGRYFSVQGGLGAALTRNMTNCAGNTMNVAVKADFTRQALALWEIYLRACQKARARAWHLSRHILLQQPPTSVGLRIGLHFARMDATNSKVWRRAKLHVATCESGFILEPPLTSDGGLKACKVEEFKFVCDIQVLSKKEVTDLAGNKILGVFDKQIELAGLAAHKWNEDRQSPALCLEDGPPAKRRKFSQETLEQHIAIGDGRIPEADAEDIEEEDEEEGAADYNTDSQRDVVPVEDRVHAEHGGLRKKNDGEDPLERLQNEAEDIEIEEADELLEERLIEVGGDMDAVRELEKMDKDIADLFKDDETELFDAGVEGSQGSCPRVSCHTASTGTGCEDVTANLALWCVTTDAGGDVRASREKMELEATSLWLWILCIDCLIHQFHIMTAESLYNMNAVADALRIGHQYYTSISMVLHSWRDNCASIASVWQERFPTTWDLFCDRIPPKPISGRWGRASAVEEFLLEGTDWAVIDDAYVTPLEKLEPKARKKREEKEKRRVPVSRKAAEMVLVFEEVISKRKYETEES